MNENIIAHEILACIFGFTDRLLTLWNFSFSTHLFLLASLCMSYKMSCGVRFHRRHDLCTSNLFLCEYEISAKESRKSLASRLEKVFCHHRHMHVHNDFFLRDIMTLSTGALVGTLNTHESYKIRHAFAKWIWCVCLQHKFNIFCRRKMWNFQNASKI